MKAVILAAGRGTRLGPLTDTVPKILAPVAGRPLLWHQLHRLSEQGVQDVAMNVHHHRRQVIDFLAGRPLPVRVRVFAEERLLGTAGALLPMRHVLDEDFLLLYGDVLTDADLARMMAGHRAGDAVATLGYYPAEGAAGKGTLELAPDGRIVSFTEKPATPAGPALINAGVHALSPEVLDYIAGEVPDLGYDVWPRMLAAGRRLEGFRIDGYVRDVGSPEMLARATQDMIAGRIGPGLPPG